MPEKSKELIIEITSRTNEDAIETLEYIVSQFKKGFTTVTISSNFPSLYEDINGCGTIKETE